MTRPIPRDPRQLGVTPEQVDNAVQEILNEPAADLAEETQQLERAHEVLREALQEN